MTCAETNSQPIDEVESLPNLVRACVRSHVVLVIPYNTPTLYECEQEYNSLALHSTSGCRLRCELEKRGTVRSLREREEPPPEKQPLYSWWSLPCVLISDKDV